MFFKNLSVRRVARIWNRGGGGLFLKSEKTANDLDPNFHCSWIRITRFIRKLRRNFLENSEIQTLFQPNNRWSRKKIRKKRSSPKLRRIFWPKSEIQTLFQPKNRWSPTKKKRSSPKSRRIFRPVVDIQTLFQAKSRHLLHNFGTQFPLEGLFSFFYQKSASKAPKTCDFAYFTGQWESWAPPPAPLATLLLSAVKSPPKM